MSRCNGSKKPENVTEEARCPSLLLKSGNKLREKRIVMNMRKDKGT